MINEGKPYEKVVKELVYRYISSSRLAKKLLGRMSWWIAKQSENYANPKKAIEDIDFDDE